MLFDNRYVSPPSFFHKICAFVSFLLVVSIAAFWSCPSVIAVEASTPKKVFVLNSFDRGYVWTDNMLQGIDEVFAKSIPPIDYTIRFMDTKKVLPTPEYFLSLKNLILTGYGNVKFDAVMACDNDAFNFLQLYRDELFPSVPVFFVSINDFSEEMLKGRKDITGTAENTDYLSTIDLALRLRPKTNNVVVITDDTTTGKAHKNAVSKIESSFAGRVTFSYLSLGNSTLEELGQDVSMLSDNNVILLLQSFVDRTGKSYTVEESTPFITARSTVPVFVVTDIRMNMGVVGGSVVSGYAHGKSSAQLVLKYFAGTNLSDIPVVNNVANIYMFDSKALSRFGISERYLPSESKIFNQESSYFDKYRDQIVILGICISIILLFIFFRYVVFAATLIEREITIKPAPLNHSGFIGNSSTKLFSIIFFTSSVTSLIGWILSIEYLKTFSLTSIAVKANESICLALLGFGLLAVVWLESTSMLRKVVLRTTGVFVFVIAFLSLIEYLFGTNIGIDQLFFRASLNEMYTPQIGLMSFIAVIQFLCGAYLLFSVDRKMGVLGTSEIISWMIALFISFVVIISYFYQLSANPFGLQWSFAMPIWVAINFLLFLYVLLINTSSNINEFVLGRYFGSSMFRKLVLFVVLSPFILGWFRMYLVSLGVLPDNAGVFFVALFNSIFGFIYLLTFSVVVNTDDRLSRSTNSELQKVKDDYDATISAVYDGLWDLDVPSGNAVFSKIFYKLLGYDNSEFVANYANWRILVHPDDIVRVEKVLFDSILSLDTFSVEFRMKTKFGNWC